MTAVAAAHRAAADPYLISEDGNVARARHFATYPEDRGANIVIFEFCEELGLSHP